jgi:predicted lipid carrier protein YhbT
LPGFGLESRRIADRNTRTRRAMNAPPTIAHPLDFLARRMPPPGVVALPVRLCPPPVQRRLLERTLNHLLAELLAEGEFDFLAGRRLAIEVEDMRLRWVVTAGEGRLQAVSDREPAEATIRGRAVEFLLLLARLEDPDTLFFQRRLEVTGDTAIGLTTRNLLDRLPFEALPLPLRIALNRAGRFARRVRRQHAPAT